LAITSFRHSACKKVLLIVGSTGKAILQRLRSFAGGIE
jgi:hypothetical protein